MSVRQFRDMEMQPAALPSDLARFVEQCLRRNSQSIYTETTEMMERYVFTRVLRETCGNQSRAAKLLGITRGCLRNRIRALRISCETRIVRDGFVSVARGDASV